MPNFKAVEEMIDSAKGAAHVTRGLTKIYSEVYSEITSGPDPMDYLPVNTEGEDADTVIRESAQVFGKPQYVTKTSNTKAEVQETKSEKPTQIHEAALTVAWNKRELRQAVKFGRDVQSRRMLLAGQEVDLFRRNEQILGNPQLGITGLISSADNYVHSQLNQSLLDMSDDDIEDFVLGILEELDDEVGSDYPVSKVIFTPAWNSRLNRTTGSNKERSLKKRLNDILMLQPQDWIKERRLKGKGLGDTYAGKDAILFIPGNKRIIEIACPVRKKIDEPERINGKLCNDIYFQHGGVTFYEKCAALVTQ